MSNNGTDSQTSHLWWKTGVIYQIYPRSFADGNGDGIGDLRGIIDRLDYLSRLGIDAIWLSPIYPSPMADFGYDISDYINIDPVFGTLDDFDELLSQAHRRGIRVILDLVPNHTSDEHPWFVESRSSLSSPKRDWYLWRDPLLGVEAPNNWVSFFGGPAWEWDEGTGQYYLHLFHRKQPDLNWRNQEVRKAIYDVMRFWFNRGVDGFRIDVLWLLIKDEDFIDNPEEPPEQGEEYVYGFFRPAFEDQPEVHTIATEIRGVADEYSGRVLIGEIYLPVERLVRYYGENLSGVHLPFNFGLVTMSKWSAETIRQVVSAYEEALPEGAWPNWVLGNHDKPRIASRTGEEGARVAQMLLLTLRGTPTCYYGDELGMHDGVIPEALAVDPQAGGGNSRDGARTPMQWSAAPNAGFTKPDATPWLPVDSSFPNINVEVQNSDPNSHLVLFRRLLALRREHPALHYGLQQIVEMENDKLMVYLREHNKDRFLVVLNFSPVSLIVDVSRVGKRGSVLCSTLMDYTGEVDIGHLALRSHEGLVIRLEG
jgi:alpha-glucosidase